MEVGLDNEAANAIGDLLAMKKLDMRLNTDVTSDGWIQFFHVLLQSKCSLEELHVSSNSMSTRASQSASNNNARLSHASSSSDCTANGLHTFTRLLQPSSKVTTLDLDGMNLVTRLSMILRMCWQTAAP